MNKNNSLILCLLLIISSIKISNGQDLSNDILKVNESYQDRKSFSMYISYNLIIPGDTVKRQDVGTGFLLKHKETLYIKKAGEISVFNDTITIHLIPDANEIVVGEAIDYKISGIGLPDIDSLIKVTGDFSLIKDDKGERVYLLKPHSYRVSPFSTFEIYIDKNTFFYSKIILGINDSQNPQDFKLEVAFTNYNLKPNLKGLHIDIGDYVLEGQQNKLILTDHYSHYKLVDLRIKN